MRRAAPASQPRRPVVPAVAELEAVRAAAAEIAAQAGADLLRRFALPFDVRFKSKKESDPVTEADEAIEAFVRREVAARFPGPKISSSTGSAVEAR